MPIQLNEPIIVAWESNLPYLFITIFEYDWYAGLKHTPIVNTPNGNSVGASISQDFRAKFSNEIYYSGHPTFVANTTMTTTLDSYIGGIGVKHGHCSTCTGSPTCNNPDISGCSDDYFEIERVN